MGGITSALLNAGNALEVFSRTFNVIQNNITNADTPGYAKQDQLLVSMPFDPAMQLTGGVALGPVISSRSEYLEHAVQAQQFALGNAGQRAGDLGQTQPLFDLTSNGGLPRAVKQFFATERQSQRYGEPAGGDQRRGPACIECSNGGRRNRAGIGQRFDP